MALYGRIVGGFTVDVFDADSAATLEKRLGVTGFAVLPPGTKHGAKDNGDGTFTNPQSATAQANLTLSRKKLRDHIVAQLGGAGIGSAALQTYIDAAKANVGVLNADKNMRLALHVVTTDDNFTKGDVTDILNGLQFSGAHKSAILDAWPVAS